MTRFDVIAVGNAIVDVIASVEPDFLVAHNIVPDAMTLIDEERAHALYAALPPAREISGGSAANSMAGLASLGGAAAFIGKVRNDQLGGIFAHDLTAAGVAYHTPPLLDGPATARSLIVVTPDGHRSMNTFLGASVLFSKADLDPQQIAAAKILYLEGYLFDRDPAKEAFYSAAEIARAADRRVALTLSDHFCVERHKAAFLDLVASHVDILFANEREITALYDVDNVETAADIVAKHGLIAAITRSEKGALIVQGDQRIVIAAEPVVEVRDTTGAGDLFAAGFLFGLARDVGLARAGQLGALAAAECIGHFGARPETSLRDLAARRFR